ncbi:zinc ribbon domain-containing protein YjdM [Corynebacterium alimapuense]|uniref:Phosphonoacetate hydrolase n=1 Tax=Corynebacterium alimapuense TaxID=1576874 RepID=A0A3M8K8T6_9CORY|nr:zinc ribbon domain-containing protein YjdM [Corynebacterium alimapuense]RNE49536.1 phosphonoacetate hydrolase [Corynebacterium alimapuense]
MSRATENPLLPPCPECGGDCTYEMDPYLVCPECAYEWINEPSGDQGSDVADEIRDSVGNILNDGDTVTVAKTLKVKGASQPIKAGTKVRNIRLVQGVGDHDIDCKIDGFGAMQLKSSVVKKA